MTKNEATKKWYYDNHTEILARRRAAYHANRDHYLAQQKRYNAQNPEAVKARYRKYYWKDPAKRKAASTKWRVENPAKRVRLQWRAQGIVFSQPEFDLLLKKQENKCGICQRIMEKPNVDHNHDTGKVRGLLCRGCNLGLGHFSDNRELLEKAVMYIKEN